MLEQRVVAVAFRKCSVLIVVAEEVTHYSTGEAACSAVCGLRSEISLVPRFGNVVREGIVAVSFKNDIFRFRRGGVFMFYGERVWPPRMG